MHKLLTYGWLTLCLSVQMAAFFAISGFAATSAAATGGPNSIASFDPAKGFKPAQSNLTAVFLQIAGSLECYGSPEPYLRYMKAEHARIEAKFQTQIGEKRQSFCPAYMDAAYFERFAANWKHMAPQLGLEPLARNTGRLMQAAIDGPDGEGTILVDVFNEHQHQVYTTLTSKKAVQPPDFDVLEASLVKCLHLDETLVPVANLTVKQQKAINPAKEIQAVFLKLFSALDAGLSATDAEKVKAVVSGIITDVGRRAQSELEIAVVEDSLDELRSPRAPYSAEQETALNAEEQKSFAAFLRESRFTKADFSALKAFYSGPYDKLSERGKDELSHRFWSGVSRPR